VFGGNYQRQTETQSVYIMHCVWNKFYEIAPLSTSIYTLLGKISLSEITKRRCAVVAKNGTAVLRRERESGRRFRPGYLLYAIRLVVLPVLRGAMMLMTAAACTYITATRAVLRQTHNHLLVCTRAPHAAPTPMQTNDFGGEKSAFCSAYATT
jgi:hypothetical protein